MLSLIHPAAPRMASFFSAPALRQSPHGMRGAAGDLLAARGESPAAFGAPNAAAALGTPFGRRCIPADCVAPPSNIPDILGRRALSAGRLAALGATPDFHHGPARERDVTD